MNITRENIDELNAVLQLNLVKEDYEEKVNTVLKDYKKKANIPGFRPGKVPFGMINKMYGKPVLIEEINKLVSESLGKYLIDEKLNILGEPMPHDGENKTIDWDNDSEFEFKFDIAVAPEIDVKVSAKDKIPYYTIKVDEKLIDNAADNYAQRMGSFTNVEEIEEKDVLTTAIVELDENNEVKEGGIFVEESRMATDVIKDEDIKKTVLAAKKGDELIIDIRKAYPSNAEIGGLLKIKSEEAGNINGNFKVSIKEIQRFAKAEINQELFDKIYGEGVVNSEEEFRAKIAEETAGQLKNDSEYKFKLDIKENFVKKFKKDLPTDFLKRWLLAINEGKYTEEDIEKDFDKFLDDLKWQLTKDKIARENNIELNEDDVKEGARNHARMQFAQYGMGNVPDEHLDSFAMKILENQEEVRRIQEGAIEGKIIEHLRGIVKIDEKEVTTEKFNKLFEN